MESHTTRRFRQAFAQLPPRVQGQARAAYRRFRDDPRHPGLAFKRLNCSQPVHSVRITRDYRALGILEGATMIWFWIGRHDEYEQMIAPLA